jgi:LacI family transcriptional regulator
MEKATLASIAEKMGVSTVAVFKALNDKSGVSEELKKKIKAYAKTVGYEPKSSHVDISKKNFLFFIAKDFFLTPLEQFYSTIFYFLTAECNHINSTLQICFINPEDPVEGMKKDIDSFKPDGIFIASEIPSSIIDYFRASPLPVVFVDYFSPLYPCNYVYVDNYQASYMLTRYLIKKGHQKIGFVGDIGRTNAIADRYFGCRKAFNEAKLPFNEAWHINKNMERESENVVLPSAEEMPTAFICHCDAAAQKLYAMLGARGLSVPNDVSVASFDNNTLCDILVPKLTSIGPHKDTYAKRALSVMVEALKGKHSDYQIRSHLVERESVKDLTK